MEFFDFYYNPASDVLIFISIVLLFLGFVGWSKSASYAKFGSAMIWACSFWAVTYAAELGAAGLKSKLFWDQMQTIGTAVLPVSWLLYISYFTNNNHRITKRKIAFIGIMPFLTPFIAFTNSFHKLYWRTWDLVEINDRTILMQSDGLWSNIYEIYIIILFLTGIGILLKYFPRGTRKKQALITLLGILVPLVAGILDISPFCCKLGISLLPFGFAVSSILIIIGFMRYGLGDIISMSYDKIVREMDTGVLIVNTENQIISINPSSFRLLGLTKSSDFPSVLLLLPNWEDWINNRSGTTIAKELILNKITIVIRISQFLCEDEVVNWIVTLNDISERKAYEEKLSRAKIAADTSNNAKSEFLTNMSHELRTPLNHIIGFTDLVLQQHFGSLNDKQAEFLEDVSFSSQHLLSLINDILDLSKIEAQKMDLIVEEVNISEVVEETISFIKDKSSKNKLSVNFKNNIQESLYLDRRKIKQILLNLLSNAVKFTPPGGSIDIVSTLRNHLFELSVSDTGIGLTENSLEKIFEPFNQLDNTITRKYSGTGLGLNLVRQMVELHGGSISARSTGLNKGSVFVVKIPV